MRMKRVKRKDEIAVYHCMSRAVGGLHLFDKRDKEVLRKMLWQIASFCGVEVLAYCIMSNHFHVLIRVPEKCDVARQELLRRFELLYAESRSPYHPPMEKMREILPREGDAVGDEWAERLKVRMADVSMFMQALKQRFTIYYNHQHNRFGTLWAERFKSVVVEDSPEVLHVVAAYIDLNPVRAGLVEDPAEYRWCSYAEAMAGNKRAQAGLASAVGMAQWPCGAKRYRLVLFGKGLSGALRMEGVISWKLAEEILEKGGEVPLTTLLRCKVRYFTEGIALGSEGFVHQILSSISPGKSPSRSRKTSSIDAPVGIFHSARKKHLKAIEAPGPAPG